MPNLVKFSIPTNKPEAKTCKSFVGYRHVEAIRKQYRAQCNLFSIRAPYTQLLAQLAILPLELSTYITFYLMWTFYVYPSSQTFAYYVVPNHTTKRGAPTRPAYTAVRSAPLLPARAIPDCAVNRRFSLVPSLCRCSSPFARTVTISSHAALPSTCNCSRQSRTLPARAPILPA